jgi:DNA-binding LacI/PurR family transcriptional regulator
MPARKSEAKARRERGGKTLKRQTTRGSIREDVVRQIQDGTLHPGDPIATAATLAEKYEVSYLTAHRTLQDLAREGYCVRHRRRGTFVSENPRMGGISAVGLPAYFQESPFHGHMIEELALRGMRLGIHGVVGRARDTPAFLKRLVTHGVKHVIRFPGQFSTENNPVEPDIWNLLRKHGIATVIINDFWTEGGPFPHVCTDEAEGVAVMMDHLIGLGHRKILLVNEVAEEARFRAMEAYRTALLRHGLPYDSTHVVNLCPPKWPQAAAVMAERMLACSTAAIVMYDLYAVGILKEFEARGVVLGRDYSLAGFDGTAEAEACGLSTVVQPVCEIVATAYSLLLPDKQREISKIRIKPSCVLRASTGPAPDTPRKAGSSRCG